VTLASGEIYEAFYSEDRTHTFFHSSSYTGNAIACAAALANLDIFEHEPVTERIRAIAEQHARHLSALRNKPTIKEVRQTGTIAAVELHVPDAGYFAGLGPKLNAFYLRHDVLLRPLGNVVYVLPPYCSTASELKRIYEIIEESLAFVAE
jgi:adenosylmethionine-8-amino-7-oxononanoate aminotransferase